MGLDVLVVEDEAVVARRLARLTTEILGPALASLTVAPDLEEARAHLVRRRVDLVLLDLSLNGADGFDLLRDVAAEPFQTIVVSAHTDRALRAYELGVRDFLGKPFRKERLALALSRVLDPALRGPVPLRHLGVRQKGSVTLLPVDEVAYVRAAGPRSELVLHDGTVVLHDKPLERLEGLLPRDFERIHRSLVVDLRRVVRLVVLEGSRYQVELSDGSLLPVGRTRVTLLRERLGAGP